MFDNEGDGLPPRQHQGDRASGRGPDQPERRLRIVDAPPDGPGQSDSPGCGCPPGYHEYGAHAPGARSNRSAFPVPPGAYPVEDLAGMSASAAELLLSRAVAEAETGVTECPHILITRDTETGVVTYNGPFPTGLEALERAHTFVSKYRGLEPRWDFTLTVAPLLAD